MPRPCLRRDKGQRNHRDRHSCIACKLGQESWLCCDFAGERVSALNGGGFDVNISRVHKELVADTPTDHRVCTDAGIIPNVEVLNRPEVVDRRSKVFAKEVFSVWSVPLPLPPGKTAMSYNWRSSMLHLSFQGNMTVPVETYHVSEAILVEARKGFRSLLQDRDWPTTTSETVTNPETGAVYEETRRMTVTGWRPKKVFTFDFMPTEANKELPKSPICVATKHRVLHNALRDTCEKRGICEPISLFKIRYYIYSMEYVLSQRKDLVFETPEAKIDWLKRTMAGLNHRALQNASGERVRWNTDMIRVAVDAFNDERDQYPADNVPADFFRIYDMVEQSYNNF